MQDDTYKIVAIRINQVAQALIELHPEIAYRLLRVLRALMHRRLKHNQEIREKIDEVNALLFREGVLINNKVKSRALDICEEAYEMLAGDLDEAGILLRVEENIENLYKRGGRG